MAAENGGRLIREAGEEGKKPRPWASGQKTTQTNPKKKKKSALLPVPRPECCRVPPIVRFLPNTHGLPSAAF